MIGLSQLCDMKYFMLSLYLLLLATVLPAQTLRLATYQYSTNTRVDNLRPLAAIIEKETGRVIEVKSYSNVQAFIEGMRNNEVDIALINTFGYILMQTSGKGHPMEAVAALTVPQGQLDNYKTIFLVKATSKVKNMKGLVLAAGGLKLALVATGSTSGNLVPRMGLTTIGINQAEAAFDTVYYAGTHQAAVEALLQGKADVAAMGQDAWVKIRQSGISGVDSLQEIWLSPEIPLGPVLFHGSLQPAEKELLKQLLLDLDRSAPAALQSLKAGWTEAKNATHFNAISADHYQPFLQQFGDPKAIAAILKQFAN